MCCAESQITGSPPLLSDLDVLCEREHEGHIKEEEKAMYCGPITAQMKLFLVSMGHSDSHTPYEVFLNKFLWPIC